MDKVTTVFVALVVFIFLLFIFLFWPFMEARTYNKFTNGKKATMLDAIFVELRVDASCK